MDSFLYFFSVVCTSFLKSVLTLCLYFSFKKCVSTLSFVLLCFKSVYELFLEKSA